MARGARNLRANVRWSETSKGFESAACGKNGESDPCPDSGRKSNGSGASNPMGVARERTASAHRPLDHAAMPCATIKTKNAKAAAT